MTQAPIVVLILNDLPRPATGRMHWPDLHSLSPHRIGVHKGILSAQMISLFPETLHPIGRTTELYRA